MDSPNRSRFALLGPFHGTAVTSRKPEPSTAVSSVGSPESAFVSVARTRVDHEQKKPCQVSVLQRSVSNETHLWCGTNSKDSGGAFTRIRFVVQHALGATCDSGCHDVAGHEEIEGGYCKGDCFRCASNSHLVDLAVKDTFRKWEVDLSADHRAVPIDDQSEASWAMVSAVVSPHHTRLLQRRLSNF